VRGLVLFKMHRSDLENLLELRDCNVFNIAEKGSRWRFVWNAWRKQNAILQNLMLHQQNHSRHKKI